MPRRGAVTQAHLEVLLALPTAEADLVRHYTLREANRPQWAALYKRQRQERRAFKDSQRGALSRFKYWLRHRREDPEKNFPGEALRAIRGRNDLAARLGDRHEAERKALAKAVGEQNRAAERQENEAYKVARRSQAAPDAGASDAQDRARQTERGPRAGDQAAQRRARRREGRRPADRGVQRAGPGAAAQAQAAGREGQRQGPGPRALSAASEVCTT